MTQVELELARGNIAAARSGLAEVQRMARNSNDAFMIYKSLHVDAQLGIADGLPVGHLFEQLLEHTRSRHLPLLELRAHLDFGDYLLAQDEPGRAHQHYINAREITDRMEVDPTLLQRVSRALEHTAH